MKMHSLILCSVLATTAVIANAAETAAPLSVQPSAGPGKTRAEVKAETLRALAAGEITFGEVAYPKLATTNGVGLTRAEVKADLRHAIVAHELHFSDTAYPDSGFYTTPRAKVRTKAVAVSPASMPAS